jgi:hypothetical protein
VGGSGSGISSGSSGVSNATSSTHSNSNSNTNTSTGVRDSAYSSASEALLLNTTHTDRTLDLVDLTVRSLSHVRLLTGTLRAVLWEACGGDQEKVRDVLHCNVLCYTILYYTVP